MRAQRPGCGRYRIEHPPGRGCDSVYIVVVVRHSPRGATTGVGYQESQSESWLGDGTSCLCRSRRPPSTPTLPNPPVSRRAPPHSPGNLSVASKLVGRAPPLSPGNPPGQSGSISLCVSVSGPLGAPHLCIASSPVCLSPLGGRRLSRTSPPPNSRVPQCPYGAVEWIIR